MSLKPSSTSPKRFLLAACAVAVAVTFAAARQPEQQPARRGAVDWIFVLDTSASMRGAGGSKDIFERVKSALYTFITSTREGDSVTVYTFDRDTSTRPTVQIADETDRRDLLHTIEGLEATGNRTHTGKAIRDALVRAAELRRRGGDARRTPAVVLLTDGIEDVRDIPSPVSIPSNVALIPNSQPYVFFISLGQEHDPQLDAFVNDPALAQRGRVVRDPGAENIEQLGEDIREPVEQAAAEATPAPTPSPVQVTIGVEPASIDFGEVEPGEVTGRETLDLKSNVDVAVQLLLEGGTAGVRLADPSGPVALKAGESTAVRVRLAAADDAPDGPRKLLIKVNVRDETHALPPDAVVKTAWSEARLDVKRVPLLRTLLWWLGALLALLLIAIIVYSAYKGTTPLGLREEWTARRMLEGELEVLRPRPPPDAAYIDIGALRSRHAALSRIVPGGTGDDDAELETAYRNGAKTVRLRRTRGGVRVNDVEVAHSDLYDGDLIEIGDARLRFNWVGHERPVESNDGLA